MAQYVSSAVRFTTCWLITPWNVFLGQIGSVGKCLYIPTRFWIVPVQSACDNNLPMPAINSDGYLDILGSTSCRCLVSILESLGVHLATSWNPANLCVKRNGWPQLWRCRLRNLGAILGQCTALQYLTLVSPSSEQSEYHHWMRYSNE